MTTVSSPTSAVISNDQPTTYSAVVFGSVVISIITAACLIAGWAPLGFSVATVFLFAGPHNWLEARYFFSKMPGRWGKLWLYFTIGLGGVLLLTVGQISMSIAFRLGEVNPNLWTAGIACWNTLFVAWIVCLMLMRARQNRCPLWEFAIPAGLVLIAVNWIWPYAWSMGMVYLHPLVALLFLDRELGRQNRDWQIVYRRCLLLLPFTLGALWWQLAAKPNLPGDDLLTIQITNHAGAGIIHGVSTHLLVSTHTFLEMLHYAVWIVAIPLVAVKSVPWKLHNVPLAKRSTNWRAVFLVLVGAGVLVMLALWACFLVNYPMTRDIYFMVALAHVLAEVPFLLRLL